MSDSIVKATVSKNTFRNETPHIQFPEMVSRQIHGSNQIDATFNEILSTFNPIPFFPFG